MKHNFKNYEVKLHLASHYDVSTFTENDLTIENKTI